MMTDLYKKTLIIKIGMGIRAADRDYWKVRV